MVVNNVAALPIGIILDNIGPKKSSIIGCILFLLGNFVMGLKPDNIGFEPFLPAYILLAIGGPMIFLSSFHLCNAFPKRSGLILSAITGAFDASSLPFVIYSAIYRRYHVSLRTWFWLYMIVPALIIVEQILLAPSKAYALPTADNTLPDEQTPLLPDASRNETDDSLTRPKVLQQRRRSNFDSSFSRVYFSNDSETHFRRKPLTEESDESAMHGGNEDEITITKGHAAPNIKQDPITGILWGRTAMQQIFTSWFWLPQLFLTCYMLRVNYEIATVFDQVFYYTKDMSVAEKVTDAFVLLLPLGGVVSIPFIGYVLDSMSSMAAFTVLLVLGLGYGALCMTTSVPAQLVGITLFTVMRPLLYTAISDYYTKVIGIETFGTVYGLANAISGLFTLVQYPIDYAVKKKLNGNYTPINAALLILGLLLSSANIAKQYFHRKKVGSRTPIRRPVE